jgi:hypothetical protein
MTPEQRYHPAELGKKVQMLPPDKRHSPSFILERPTAHSAPVEEHPAVQFYPHEAAGRTIRVIQTEQPVPEQYLATDAGVRTLTTEEKVAQAYGFQELPSPEEKLLEETIRELVIFRSS